VYDIPYTIQSQQQSLQAVGVLIAAVLIWTHQGDIRWTVVDPIATFLFSVMVAVASWNVSRDIIDILMERTPRNLDQAK
jgi:solute carrier family 30 (zinc transporter), member 2